MVPNAATYVTGLYVRNGRYCRYYCRYIRNVRQSERIDGIPFLQNVIWKGMTGFISSFRIFGGSNMETLRSVWKDNIIALNFDESGQDNSKGQHNCLRYYCRIRMRVLEVFSLKVSSSLIAFTLRTEKLRGI